jgi:hypothetical protein
MALSPTRFIFLNPVSDTNNTMGRMGQTPRGSTVVTGNGNAQYHGTSPGG